MRNRRQKATNENLELKNTITKRQNTSGPKRRMEFTEENVTDNRLIKTIHSEKPGE